MCRMHHQVRELKRTNKVIVEALINAQILSASYINNYRTTLYPNMYTTPHYETVEHSTQYEQAATEEEPM